jgi:hypothetical protein
MLNLNFEEQQYIVDQVRLNFVQTIIGYDAAKYPEDAYDDLLLAFRSPATIVPDNISDALRWKYGHWKKDNYPETHKAIIRNVQSRWAVFANRQIVDARQIFDYWTGVLEQHNAFITIVFLTHLLRSDTIPIIDQHNFRAMNSYMRAARPNWRYRNRPSRFDDVLDLHEFMQSIIQHWTNGNVPEPPTQRSLDKYLMVRGRQLKQLKNTK